MPLRQKKTLQKNGDQDRKGALEMREGNPAFDSRTDR